MHAVGFPDQGETAGHARRSGAGCDGFRQATPDENRRRSAPVETGQKTESGDAPSTTHQGGAREGRASGAPADGRFVWGGFSNRYIRWFDGLRAVRAVGQHTLTWGFPR